jgi:hypothetical protein
MKLGRQLGAWLGGLSLLAALALPAAAKQHPPKERPPAPAPKAPKPENRHNDRPPNAGGGGSAKPFHPNRSVTPPPNPQERWRNMTPQQKKDFAQRDQQLRRMTPQQRQELQSRAQVWSRMTPEQRDHVRNDVLPKWRQMSPERKQAIQQRLRVLQNMPESARNERLNDPNFTRGMSEDDKSTLRDLSHLHVGGAPDPPSE